MKLNIFQRGILQKCATVFVYLGSIVIVALFLGWLDKRLFISLAEEAQQKKILSPEAARAFATLIEARDSTTIITIILVGLVCGFVGWIFMRWGAKRNWSWWVTLPRAVEFRSAMERLGIADPADRIAFVRKYKLPVFIASAPIVGTEQNEVRARLYAFAHHSSLGGAEVFERHTGSQTLCLDAESYEHMLKKHGQKGEWVYLTRIVALEEDITALKAANSLHVADIATLTEKNKTLLAENDDLRNKLRTVSGRDGKTETSTIRRIPFWRVAAPLVTKLIEQAGPSTRYSGSDIQSAFEEALEEFPELKAAIKEELHAGKRLARKSEFDLTGWSIDAIKAALGNLAKTEPGPSRKG